ncbi:MAG TPA: antitoxin Xre/MbcA/ParS toxin-binding domain-containing protein [Anaeromyxobacteraceae bacterium]|nr:antitoxin Xre/MbcA/ParS toxin-binding domain-containing protein [Anaeromyxobacteraceae bacterium]
MPRLVRVSDPGSISRGAVLTKATRRAAEHLGLSDAALAEVLGVSPSTVSRLSEERPLDPSSREAEFALLFIRVFRGLDALLGDLESCRKWLRAKNAHLGGVPADLIRTVEGLVRVTQYLDAMRGKL